MPLTGLHGLNSKLLDYLFAFPLLSLLRHAFPITGNTQAHAAMVYHRVARAQTTMRLPFTIRLFESQLTLFLFACDRTRGGNS